MGATLLGELEREHSYASARAGDRNRAEAWFRKYADMPAELKAALSKTGSVPVDVDPITAFGDAVK